MGGQSTSTLWRICCVELRQQYSLPFPVFFAAVADATRPSEVNNLEGKRAGPTSKLGDLEVTIYHVVAQDSLT
jgi:hypothetical protein